MSTFERRGSEISLLVTRDEVEILINLTEQLLELLGEGDFFHHYDTTDPLAQLLLVPEEIATPEDPVLKRLLPNAYADPEAASDFRRYTEPALRGSKQRALRKVREDLLVILELDEEAGTVEDLEPDTWLMALNDLRLALSVRLDVDSDSYESFELLPDEDPNKPVFAVYFWLGWLQEKLLGVLQ